MEFNQFTLALLLRRPDAPKIVGAEENLLQEEHLAFLTKLRNEGHELVAGPVTGSQDRKLRGVCIFRGTPDEVRALMQKDPWFRVGCHDHEYHSWIVPRGEISFPKDHLRLPLIEIKE
jgi:uncharacterized protein YciI